MDDTLVGGESDDTILGGSGNDSIRGNGGDDSIEGGADNDTLLGGEGNDTLKGDDANDFLRGEEGSDILSGGTGADNLDGGTGSDTLQAGVGSDRISDSLIEDAVVDGGTDDDKDILVLYYLEQSVSVTVEILADEINVIGQHSTQIEYDGIDEIWFDFGIDGVSGDDSLNAAEVDAQIVVYADAGDDTVIGGAYFDFLYGWDGNDSLNGGGGIDVLLGGFGADTLTGGDGDDNFFYQSPDEIDDIIADFESGDRIVFEHIEELLLNFSVMPFFSPSGAFTGRASEVIAIETGQGTYIRYDHDGDLVADGEILLDGFTDPLRYEAINFGLNIFVADQFISQFGEEITGTDKSDQLVAAASATVLNAGLGNDTLVGGDGSDTLRGEAGRDLADYSNSFEGVQISLLQSGGSGLGGTAQGDVLSGIELLVGSSFADDLLSTSDENHEFFGMSGDDSLTGGSGDDSLFGGSDDDTLAGNSGEDLLIGGSGSDLIMGGDGNDLLIGDMG